MWTELSAGGLWARAAAVRWGMRLGFLVDGRVPAFPLLSNASQPPWPWAVAGAARLYRDVEVEGSSALAAARSR